MGWSESGQLGGWPQWPLLRRTRGTLCCVTEECRAVSCVSFTPSRTRSHEVRHRAGLLLSHLEEFGAIRARWAVFSTNSLFRKENLNTKSIFLTAACTEHWLGTVVWSFNTLLVMAMKMLSLQQKCNKRRQPHARCRAFVVPQRRNKKQDRGLGVPLPRAN